MKRGEGLGESRTRDPRHASPRCSLSSHGVPNKSEGQIADHTRPTAVRPSSLSHLGPGRFLESESQGAGFFAVFEVGDSGPGSFLEESHCRSWGFPKKYSVIGYVKHDRLCESMIFSRNLSGFHATFH